ncbi:MAG TPA: hypothetical protein VFM94_05095 [Solirubrobacterales bacterium]|nr:hypothetical protein [Solirubrobacterales bacterium]
MRKLKVVGTALFLLSLTSALSAPASAQSGQLTAESFPVHLEGFQTLAGANRFTAFGLVVECPQATGAGDVGEASETITVFPSNPGPCTAGGFPATITTNGCDTLLHIGETTMEDRYSGTVDLLCPAGKSIEMHVYASATHSLKLCQYRIFEQVGLGGGTVTNDTKGHLILGGAITGITIKKTGLCGAAETQEGIFEGEATVVGTNKMEEPVGIQISD